MFCYWYMLANHTPQPRSAPSVSKTTILRVTTNATSEAIMVQNALDSAAHDRESREAWELQDVETGQKRPNRSRDV